MVREDQLVILKLLVLFSKMFRIVARDGIKQVGETKHASYLRIAFKT